MKIFSLCLFHLGVQWACFRHFKLFDIESTLKISILGPYIFSPIPLFKDEGFSKIATENQRWHNVPFTSLLPNTKGHLKCKPQMATTSGLPPHGKSQILDAIFEDDVKPKSCL